MPTIIRKDGFRVVIYPNDHLPPHVHVLRQDGEVRVELSETFAPRILSIVGKIGDKDVVKALDIVKVHQVDLLTVWREIHGSAKPNS
jgi:Domain of unknown function (DUF4160)